jgi:hypothetical protein
MANLALSRRRLWGAAFGPITASILCYLLLAGCAQTEARQTTLQATDPTSRPIPPIMLTRWADETRIAQYRAQLETAVALTPRPPRRTPPPPMPTPTWAMGWVGCANGRTLEPQRYSCWRGVFNGELLTVAAGQQSVYSDRAQGLLLVYHGGLMDSSAPNTEVYSTPLRLGGVSIIAMTGTLFTLAPYDPWAITPGVTATPGITFVFDLATRQWVSPPPSPSPSPALSPPPLPSPSPLHSPLPTP